MKIKDRLDFFNKPHPVCFRPTDTVKKALDIMCKKNIGSVVITSKDNKVKGIVTERDMMTRVLGKGLDPTKTKITKVMTKDVITAHENDNLVDWIKVMSTERFRHLPIVDENNNLITMLSQGDLVAFTHPDLDEKIRTDLKGRLADIFQIFLILFAIATLGFIGLKM